MALDGDLHPGNPSIVIAPCAGLGFIAREVWVIEQPRVAGVPDHTAAATLGALGTDRHTGP
jgi:hypothetical protein